MAKITKVSKETEEIMRNKSPVNAVFVICIFIVAILFLGVSI